MTFDAKSFIERTRDHARLSEPEIRGFVEAYVRGDVPDYQAAAWLMAVYLNGLSEPEMVWLTRAMLESGARFPRASRDEFWIDKHSTGGVGDKTSLLLVPLVATVCDETLGPGRVKIPMVSGRGLGHSGGTLDKLESVPGFRTDPSMEEAMALVARNGFVMMGPTEELAPADRKLYALRDSISTVESQALIVSSILSKKLAESIDGLVLDVKTGRGAFMGDDASADRLARALVGVARDSGIAASAALTAMDEPLGTAVGHWLEVHECDRVLAGESADRGLVEVVLELAAQMVALASRGTVPRESARDLCSRAIGTRAAHDRFRALFTAQGGDWAAFERAGSELLSLPRVDIPASREGWIAGVDAKRIGLLVGTLGGSRQRVEDRIDPLVGISGLRKIGDRVKRGESLARVHFRNETDAPAVARACGEAFLVSETPVAATGWIKKVIG